MITTFENFNRRKASVQQLYTGPALDMAICSYSRASEDEFFMPQAAVTCVKQGRKVVYLNGEKHEMKAGDMLYVPKFSVIYSDIAVGKENFQSVNVILHNDAPCNGDAAALLAGVAATITHPLPMAELARLQHMSLSTFKRHVHRDAGESAGQWLIGRRLERARYLLEHKMFSVSQACHDSGFHDLSYFIRKFRERFGVTPGSLRN